MTPDGGTGRPHTNSVVARWEGGWRCRVEAGGISGWLMRDEIWGVYPSEVIQ